MSTLFQKYFYIPVIIIWLIILVKHRHALTFKSSLFKGAFRPGKEVFLPLLIIVCFLLTFALRLPFSYDESFTFNVFTSQGVIASIATYPVPNNHVFHSILTNFTWGIFGFTHSELVVRLPALFFSLLTLYFVFTRYLNRNIYSIVLFGMFWFFSPYIVEFAFQARGYSIQIFCGVSSYFFATDSETRKNVTFRSRLNIILLITAVGLFTSPAYLYTACSVYLIFVTCNLREIRKDFVVFGIINVFYGLTVVLLYTPIIASEGLHQITANQFVRPINDFSVDRVLSHLKDDLVKYLTLPHNLGWITVILFIWNSIKRKTFHNFSLLVVPFILMIVLEQIPFNRIFLPIGAIILVNACVALIDNNGFKNITAGLSSLKFQIPALLLLVCTSLLSAYYFNNYHKKDDLVTAYNFKLVRDHIVDHNKVYTKDINSNWNILPVLWAFLKLKEFGPPIEIEKDLKEYNFKNAIILSTQPLPGYKVVASTSNFSGKPILIIDPNK